MAPGSSYLSLTCLISLLNILTILLQSPPQFETYASIASVATASINCTSFALSFALFEVVSYDFTCVQSLTYCLDYFCLSFYSDLPSRPLACFDHIICSAAWLVWQIPKFSHMSQITCWMSGSGFLSISTHRVASLVWQCQLDLGPAYLINFC